MRDLLLIVIVITGCIAALKRPWIGVMLWTWLSIMSPHRYTWGIAYSAPLAASAAVCTLLGLLMTRERASPFKGSPVTWLVIFMVWMTLSWLFGLHVATDYEQWKKVIKIDVMLLVALMLLHRREHIMALMWVCVGSLALLGIKGGVFTLTGGGASRVFGPPGSFIEENNSFALALIVIIPLLRFLQLQVQHKLGKIALIGTMVLCTAAALGSQSRGALVAIAAMALTLWWRGSDKLRVGVLMLAVAVPLIAFMPDQWTARMSSIQTYEEDSSAMGRINAWWAAWNIAMRYPFGAGFDPATPELFARFAPVPTDIHAAHSIFFQVLGNHGFIGLFLFLSIWFATWRAAGWLRAQKNLLPETKWTADLGAMCQVAMVGYFVGGAFLSLAYFDLPYNVMALVVLTRVWVDKQSWKTETLESPRWMTLLGLTQPKKEN
jgi:putative inorganic carbon (HCO3(-)) transporter